MGVVSPVALHRFDPQTLGELRFQLAQLRTAAKHNTEKAAALTPKDGRRIGAVHQLAIDATTERAAGMARRAADYELLLTLATADPHDDPAYCGCGCDTEDCQCVRACTCGPECPLCDEDLS